nr:MFS transporter [Klebsiella pneumoniae subsp. pneumoniae]
MIVDSWNGQMGWRWMFGAELVPALAFLVLMFFVPESPRWLMKAGKPGAPGCAGTHWFCRLCRQDPA